ncbi:MAG TPA: Hsp20/alpha crystallin family protein [Nitrososphaerales archaeon]|nr:Hsp20/alpha crystallin family protein [Nitrososphaerales archaeon]
MTRIKCKKRSGRRKARWNYRRSKLMQDFLRAEDNADKNRISTNQNIYLINKLQQMKAIAESLLRDLEDENSLESVNHPRQPLMLPERISGRNRDGLATFDSEIRRRFLEWRNRDPVIETTVDTKRNELRLVALMLGVRKEDLEIEVTQNCLVLRTSSLKGGENLAAAIPFYVPVIPRSIETSFVNGILEARFKLKKDSNEYYKVRIK